MRGLSQAPGGADGPQCHPCPRELRGTLSGEQQPLDAVLGSSPGSASPTAARCHQAAPARTPTAFCCPRPLPSRTRHLWERTLHRSGSCGHLRGRASGLEDRIPFWERAHRVHARADAARAPFLPAPRCPDHWWKLGGRLSPLCCPVKGQAEPGVGAVTASYRRVTCDPSMSRPTATTLYPPWFLRVRGPGAQGLL